MTVPLPAHGYGTAYALIAPQETFTSTLPSAA
jgi:hypothetical protein